MLASRCARCGRLTVGETKKAVDCSSHCFRSLLPLAWLAPDRSELRAVAWEPAFERADRRTLADDAPSASYSGG
jgi:hypothetical protein